jgi:hypothetical protein
MACAGGSPSPGDSSSPGDAADTADVQATADAATPFDAGASVVWADVCNQAATRVACDGAAFDVANCVRVGSCIDRDYRPELAAAYAACFSAEGCGKSLQECENDAARPYANDPAAQTYNAACTARRAVCIDAGTPFNGDNCELGVAILLNQQILAAWTACLSQPCASAPSCFTAPLGPSCQ